MAAGACATYGHRVIRNAILHVIGEQPLLADLPESPSPNDGGVLCTNVRYMNGRRPIFIEQPDSVFLFPMSQIRFVEIPRAAPVAALVDEAAPDDEKAEPVLDLDIDEDFLRRIREA